MKKICNLIILDASGSMTDKAAEVRHGLLNLFADIRTNDRIKNRTIVCDFSSAGDFRILINTRKSEKLTDTVADAYGPRGMTALYDAIGKAFLLVDKKYDGVFVNIMTDGLENNSVEFRLKDIQGLISKKRRKGWAITFMGTTEEAINEAASWGVSQGNIYKYADSVTGTKRAASRRQKARNAFTDIILASDVDNPKADSLMIDDDEV